MPGGVFWSAGPKSQHVLDALGRTEDVMFSPSGQRLAVAGFRVNRIAVFAIQFEQQEKKRSVRLTDVVEIESPGLRGPHGLCFLDEDTLAVANRGGSVTLFDIPLPSAVLRHSVNARQTLVSTAAAKIDTPGSLAVFPVDAHSVELLVCNNYANTVTRHVLDRRNGFRVTSEQTLLADQLSTPDGICFSPDGRWIAVSNHNTHSVLLYDRGARGERSARSDGRQLSPGSVPDGTLLNVLCPHGVRFTDDMAHILVADAGAPFVNVYDRSSSNWRGRHEPSRLFPSMSRSLFLGGQHNPQEGGPKGIDIKRRCNLLVTTCETQTLAFFDLNEVLCQGEAPVRRGQRLLRWRIANALFNRLGLMVRGTL